MAAPGTYAAWQRLRPLEGDVAQDVKDWEQMDMAQREQNRADAKIKMEQKEKKKKEKDEFRKNTLQDLKFVPTGVPTIDEYNIQYLNMAKQQMGKDYERGMELGKKSTLTPEEQQELIKIDVRSNAFRSLPENLAAYTKGSQEQLASILKGIDSGEFYDEPKYREIREKGLSAFTPALDENGELQAGLGDLDGDGEFEVIKWNDVNNALAFKPMKKYDANSLALETSKEIGYHESEVQKGIRTVSSKGWREESFNNAVDGVFNNFEKVKSLAREYKIGDYNNLTPEDIKKTREKFANDVRSSEGTKNGVDLDLTEARLSEESRRAAKAGKAKKPKLTAGEGVVPSKEAWGSHYKTIGKDRLSVPLSGDFVLPSINVRYGKTKAGKALYKSITDARIENFSSDGKGNIVLDVSYADDKTTRKEVDGPKGKNTTTTTSKGKNRYQILATRETKSKLAEALDVSIEDLERMTIKPDSQHPPMTQNGHTYYWNSSTNTYE